MFEDAIRECERAMKLWGSGPDELAGLERAHKQSGASGYWKWKLSKTKSRQAPYEIAVIYAQIGDARQAAVWLQKHTKGTPGRWCN